jgi:hypothetical protein
MILSVWIVQEVQSTSIRQISARIVCLGIVQRELIIVVYHVGRIISTLSQLISVSFVGMISSLIEM